MAELRTDEHTIRLVERFRSGDKTALLELMDDYRGLVRAAARRFLHSRDDVEDVVQDTWLKFVTHADTIRSPERIAGWLWTTATNDARRAARRASRISLTDEENVLNAAGGVEDSAETEATREVDATCRAVRAALATIDEKDRRLIELLMADDAPAYAEISKVVGRPVGSIGPTRQRILARLARVPEIRKLAAANLAAA